MNVATRTQALSASRGLYREALDLELPWPDGLPRAKNPRRVLSRLTWAEGLSLQGRIDDAEGGLPA
ncbi:MAG TPA: hypothetical protein PLT48_15550, partial [Nitrospira sp.]|nr:hypothetical protein [Nitrospira sp.]